MNPERYRVRIARDHLTFSSAHFISFAGHQCERLHGHNYRAEVSVDGPLGEDFYAVDFVALTRVAKAIVAELDHRMLLPTTNPVIRVEEVGPQVVARYQDREWRFPRGDCFLMPVENTTAELIAKWIAGRLLEALEAELNFRPARLAVEVEENVGQSAAYFWPS